MTWSGRLLTVAANLINYLDLTKILTIIRPNLELGNFLSFAFLLQKALFLPPKSPPSAIGGTDLSASSWHSISIVSSKPKNRPDKLRRSGVQLSERRASLGIMVAHVNTTLQPLEHLTTMVSSDVREEGGGSICSPLCREYLVSRTAEVYFPSPRH